MKKYWYVFCFVFILVISFSFDSSVYQFNLPLTSGVSLMRIGVDPHPLVEEGKEIAALVWDAIENSNIASAKKAIQSYDSLIQKKSRIVEFSALKWLCQCIIASEEEKKSLITDQLSEDFYQFFTDSNFVHLKEYLLRKYRVNDFDPEDPDEHLERRTYLEDLLMFNNPRRNDWERSDEILKHIPLKEGDKVIDIGCGFGFYSYQFSRMVGSTGKVYAVDAGESYVKYVDKFVKKYNISNIEPVVSTTTDVSVDDLADVAFMCSLYHIVYGWARETERSEFLNTVKRSLKKDGYLIIADNSFLNGEELNNCYLNKELAIAQLTFYGFRFLENIQITPQRYVLVFRHRPGQSIDFSTAGEEKDKKTFNLNITSGNSIVHIGSLDSYDITEEGIRAGKLVLDALENNNIAAAEKAIGVYNNLIPKENFGGEYSALQWFCEYMVASEKQKTIMLEDPLINAYYNYLGKDTNLLIKEYVKYKYKLDKEGKKEEESKTLIEEDREIGRTRRAFLEDFILFNNPKREDWEKTSKIMELLNFKKGDTIADIGCGSGYYSYRFSKMVGEEGKVYAIDIKERHLDFINEFTEKNNIKNIRTIVSEEDDISLDNKVDYVFMCSLYHIIYGVFPEPVRSKLINSIKDVLKHDGRLIIVDNGPVEDENLPYHGPFITKELIIYQLAYYGFTFEKYEQIIPQRYMLTFKLD
jgi:ubiquinone/menaquinone biosynthesis C-methylase UbiE